MRKVSLVVAGILLLFLSVFKVVSAANEPPTEMTQDQFLSQHNISIKAPIMKAANPLTELTESDAVSKASLYADLIAKSAKDITVQFQLLTYPEYVVSESAIKANPDLEDGLHETPVYIVTFQGVNIPSMGGVPHGSSVEKTIFHERSIVIDAKSGEVLFSYSYK